MTFIRLLSSIAIISLGCGTAWAQDDLWTIDKSELEDSSDVQVSPEAPSEASSKSIYDILLDGPTEDKSSETKPSETKPTSIYDQLLSGTPYDPSVQPQADSQPSEPRKINKLDLEAAGRRFMDTSKAQALAAKREEAERAARQANEQPAAAALPTLQALQPAQTPENEMTEETEAEIKEKIYTEMWEKNKAENKDLYDRLDAVRAEAREALDGAQHFSDFMNDDQNLSLRAGQWKTLHTVKYSHQNNAKEDPGSFCVGIQDPARHRNAAEVAGELAEAPFKGKCTTHSPTYQPGHVSLILSCPGIVTGNTDVTLRHSPKRLEFNTVYKVYDNNGNIQDMQVSVKSEWVSDSCL